MLLITYMIISEKVALESGVTGKYLVQANRTHANRHPEGVC
jgi:hypothetical protein